VGESERDAQVRLVNGLWLAAWDMKQAHLPATSIPNPAYKPLRVLLETALAVSYARPFTMSHARLNLGG
jgi:hypothetical protein